MGKFMVAERLAAPWGFVLRGSNDTFLPQKTQLNCCQHMGQKRREG